MKFDKIVESFKCKLYCTEIRRSNGELTNLAVNRIKEKKKIDINVGHEMLGHINFDMTKKIAHTLVWILSSEPRVCEANW